MDWFENENLFRKEVKEGHRWERYVCSFLALNGLPVKLGTSQTVRDHVSQRHAYKNSIDLRMKDRRFEVKSRKLGFTNPLDFPHGEIFVDTVSGWEGKDPLPDLLICISRASGSMIAISHEHTKEFWQVNKTHDNTRNIDDAFYEAHRRLWLPMHLVIPMLWDDSLDAYPDICQEYHGKPLNAGVKKDPGIQELLADL